MQTSKGLKFFTGGSIFLLILMVHLVKDETVETELNGRL